jgi:NAD(P)-dependent dehydrogenase (short-subunit alcohol dehydrogenase family)
LDLTQERSIEGLARDIDALDVLINNAGIANDEDTGIGTLGQAALAEAFLANAAGPLLLTQALLPALARGKRKLLVHITSRMGSIADNTSGGSYAYRMSKAALNMASKSLSVDLAPQGIVSVVLHPGWVKTDMGGSGAPLALEPAVRDVLAVIDGLSAKDSGNFLNYKGQPIPY